jgi:hypothetical protein
LKKIIAILMATFALSPCLHAQSRAARRVPMVKQAASPQVSKASLSIRRVVLYSNGVAYIERRGPVSGHAEVDLSFKQSQVDDVLKSMLVLDLGRGRIGAVSYNSSAPPSARLNEIPFSIESGTNDKDEAGIEGGLAAVLTQLQGARVVVTTANRITQGAILTVEKRTSQIDAQRPPVTTHSLVIASDLGELASFDLAEVRSVRLLDEVARHDVTEFAGASAAARRRDAKTITVTSDGAGPREMVVSYTVAAPIWKTTYRVVLDGGSKPFFQGWAIVDNVGDEDWSDVSLSLVSGMPVSFIQPLQQPLYRYRPVIEIPENLELEPQTHDTGVGPGRAYNMGGGNPAVGEGVGSGSGAGAGLSRGDNAAARRVERESPAPEAVTTVSDAVRGEDSGVKAAATGNEIGDLFEYHIEQPVTVRRDRSALIPIVQAQMEGERVSIYNEAARKDRPMSGLLLKNSSALTFEGGSLTVIDGDAYAGEALIERLKPGEERLISFAVDLGTLITAQLKADREPAFLVRAVNGVLQAHYYQTNKKIYTITNQTDRPRVVYVEHPIRQQWSLSDDTAKPIEKSATVYRFRVQLKPRESVDFPVTERLALMDSYALSNLTPRDIELFVSRRYIDASTQAALEKIMGLKGKIADVNARISAADAEAAEIAKDQARLRENIKALGETSEARQLIARYVAKATEQETRLEQIMSERNALITERTRLQSELDEAIRLLALDRKLQQ